MGHGLKRLDMIFQLCHVRQEGMIVVFLYSCTPSQWCVALGFNSRRWIYLSSVSGGAFYSWNNFKLMVCHRLGPSNSPRWPAEATISGLLALRHPSTLIAHTPDWNLANDPRTSYKPHSNTRSGRSLV
ncbi:uncharacterized protein isoform X3 [Danio rerio]|uniref:Uncharacterized protein isoform X3 n=1 Tax=Danio rerio TaxID=7955 RepID=A0AC58JF63_DANRE